MRHLGLDPESPMVKQLYKALLLSEFPDLQWNQLRQLHAAFDFQAAMHLLRMKFQVLFAIGKAPWLILAAGFLQQNTTSKVPPEKMDTQNLTQAERQMGRTKRFACHVLHSSSRPATGSEKGWKRHFSFLVSHPKEVFWKWLNLPPPTCSGTTCIYLSCIQWNYDKTLFAPRKNRCFFKPCQATLAQTSQRAPGRVPEDFALWSCWSKTGFTLAVGKILAFTIRT